MTLIRLAVCFLGVSLFCTTLADQLNVRNSPLNLKGVQLSLPAVSLTQACKEIAGAYHVPLCLEYTDQSGRKRVTFEIQSSMVLDEVLSNICQQVGDEYGYVVVEQDFGILNLVPKSLAQKMRDYPIQKEVLSFTVTNQPLIEAYHELISHGIVQKHAFDLSGIAEVPSSFSNSDVQTIVTELAQHFAQQLPSALLSRATNLVNISATNTTVRDIFNRVAAQVSNTFWEANISGTNCYVDYLWIRLPP